MPGASYDVIEYENNASAGGGGSSSMALVCDWDDRDTIRSYFLGSVDPNDGTLKCMSGRIAMLNPGGPDASLKARIDLSFAPADVVEKRDIDKAFKTRGGIEGFAITTGGSTYVWTVGGEPVESTNTRVLPTKEVTIVEVVLYGTRSVFDLSTYTAYKDKVNSDTFMGADPETVLFKTMTWNERQDDAGGKVYDIELHLSWKPTGWNNFWREDVGEFRAIEDDGGDGPYLTAAFSDLLADPT